MSYDRHDSLYTQPQVTTYNMETNTNHQDPHQYSDSLSDGALVLTGATFKEMHYDTWDPEKNISVPDYVFGTKTDEGFGAKAADTHGFDNEETDFGYYLKPSAQISDSELVPLVGSSTMLPFVRCGPEGSPSFKEAVNVINVMDETGELFAPKRVLNFSGSALDETAATEEIIPQGLNRSVSTPNKKVLVFMGENNCISEVEYSEVETDFLANDLIQFSKQENHRIDNIDRMQDPSLLFSPLNQHGLEIAGISDCVSLAQQLNHEHMSPQSSPETNVVMNSVISDHQEVGQLPNMDCSEKQRTNLLVNVPKMTLDNSKGESPGEMHSGIQHSPQLHQNMSVLRPANINSDLLLAAKSNDLNKYDGTLTCNARADAKVLSNVSNSAGDSEVSSRTLHRERAPCGIPRFTKPTASSINKSRVPGNEFNTSGKKMGTDTKQASRRVVPECNKGTKNKPDDLTDRWLAVKPEPVPVQSRATFTAQPISRPRSISFPHQRSRISKQDCNQQPHMGHGLSQSMQSTANQKDLTVDVDVQGMEEVRSHLQDMLQLNQVNSLGETKMSAQMDAMNRLLYDEASPPIQIPGALEYGRPVGFNPVDDVSVLLENFPSFTSHIWSESVNVSRNDISLQAENQHLKDVLEKERYRRKHCEHYIQHLNVKLLETQQQLAVAVSTDKRKDIMIEQLDKQLAKVVEGWKRRDLEKEDKIGQLGKEKSHLEETMIKQQHMVEGFEEELSDAVQSLHREKEVSSQIVEELKEQLTAKDQEVLHALEVSAAEQERNQLMTKEWEHAKELRDQADKKIQTLQDKLHNEQDEWFRREQQLLQRIEEVGEHHKKLFMDEKAKSEEQLDINREVLGHLQSTQTDVKKLELELDAAVREKESLKVEMGIMEAKFESAQCRLEADLHSQMEKEIAEQISDIHRQSEKTQEELQATYRKQIQELHQQQSKDLEQHMAELHGQMSRLKEEHRKQNQELEEKLHEYRHENKQLKLNKQKSESQRLELLSKLQYMMQHQWTEAVSMLGNTPQRKSFQQTSDNVSIQQGLNFSIMSQAGPVTSSPARDVTPRITSPGQNSLNREVMPDTQQQQQQPQQQQQQPQQQQPNSHNQNLDQLTDDGVHEFLHSSITQHPGALQSQTEIDRFEKRYPQNIRFSDFLGQCLMDTSGNYSQERHMEILGSSIPSQTVDLTLANQNIPSYQVQTEPGPLPTDTSQHVTVAVPMKPPQQHASFSLPLVAHTNQDSVHYVSLQDANYLPKQLHSPPTKQSCNQRQASSTEEEKDEVSFKFSEAHRLNTEYSQIAERVQEHEHRQTELQHYIQMLLNRAPSEHDDSSALEQTGDDLDLNDTAQAAQLQKELFRIQHLREKQAQTVLTTDSTGGISSNSEKKGQSVSQSQPATSSDLDQDQLASLSHLLSLQQLQGHAVSSNPDGQVSELINILKGIQSRYPSQNVMEVYSGQSNNLTPTQRKNSPKSPRLPEMDKVNVSTKSRRHLQFVQYGGMMDGSQPKPENGSSKVAHSKKLERKVAPSSRPGQTKNNVPAWK